MTIILAKDFNSRNDLENYVRSTTGLTPILKPKYVIKGNKQELNKLFLSDKSLFWGIRAEITNNKEKTIKKENNINRGEIIKSGINIKN